MKKLNLILLLFVVLFIACNDSSQLKNYDDDDCSNFSCDTLEPFYTDLNIKFSRTNETPNPLITVLTGRYGEGKIIAQVATDTIDNSIYSVKITVPINSFYTAYTTYTSNNDTITSIDGDFVFKQDYEQCDYHCWKIKNSRFNISMK